MLYRKNKISVRQIMLLVMTMIFTPSVRSLAQYTAKEAAQAGWVAPIFSFFFFVILIYIYRKIFSKYKKESFTAIISDIFSGFVGKPLIFLYILWLTVLAAFYLRIYAERLIITAYPDIDIKIFILTMLGLIAFALRFSFVPLARFGEIAFTVIIFIFFSLWLLAIPNYNLNYVLPVRYPDVLPILKGSVKVLAYNVYIIILFLLCSQVSDKNNTPKIGLQGGMFLSFSQTLLAFAVFATIGTSLITRTSYSFLLVVKQISLYGTIERIEALIIASWIMADFVLIGVLVYCVLDLIKQLFGLSEQKGLLNIYLIFLYFFSVYFCVAIFGIEKLAEEVLIPVNVIMGFCVPVLLFTVGKIRGKI